MAALEFEVNGKEYRAGRMDAFKQFHVSRRIAPIIPTLVPMFVEISRDQGKGNQLDNIDALAPLLQPFADGLAAMKDEDAEYVMATCLGVVLRHHGDSWTPVWNKAGNVCLFDDMDLGDMIQIVIKVIGDSLGPFIQGLLISQQSGPAE